MVLSINISNINRQYRPCYLLGDIIYIDNIFESAGI